LKPSDIVPTPLTLSSLSIGDYSYNTTRVNELILNHMPHLKSLVIGTFSFNNTRIFSLYRLTSLETVLIRQTSFITSPLRRQDGEFYIANCPKLQSIEFHQYAFADYNFLTVNDLPSLQSILFGGGSFYYTPTLRLLSWFEWNH